MLLWQKSLAEGTRALLLKTAVYCDHAIAAQDGQ